MSNFGTVKNFFISPSLIGNTILKRGKGKLKFIAENLKADVKIPKPFGVFHLAFLFFSVLSGVWLCRKYRNPSENQVRKILLFFSVSVLILELLKQIYYSFSLSGGKLQFSYNWRFFPFQFCSTPMYAGVLGAVVKKEKIHRALCSFLATFASFAGACVMVYPKDVLTHSPFINFQTLFCHGSMVAVGFFLSCRYVETEFRTVLRALPVFLYFIALAVALNEVAHRIGIEDFNMFFLSPYEKPYLPVFSEIQQAVPFGLSILLYAAGFTVLAFGIILICRVIKHLSKR